MKVYNPQGVFHSNHLSRCLKNHVPKPNRVLMINNQRPSAYPIIPLFSEILNDRAYTSTIVQIPSGISVEKIRDYLNGYDTVVIGVGD